MTATIKNAQANEEVVSKFAKLILDISWTVSIFERNNLLAQKRMKELSNGLQQSVVGIFADLKWATESAGTSGAEKVRNRKLLLVFASCPKSKVAKFCVFFYSFGSLPSSRGVKTSFLFSSVSVETEGVATKFFSLLMNEKLCIEPVAEQLIVSLLF